MVGIIVVIHKNYINNSLLLEHVPEAYQNTKFRATKK